MKQIKLLFCRFGFHDWVQMSIKHQRCKSCGKKQILSQYDIVDFWDELKPKNGN
ncbi:hypothetical protein [uncultured Mucilaginibacter sp.]|uniref:hypothetical protein n=1 Tax=uncultured Mucilaginibacter sp. TaxID=797541 RepID=UPI0025EF46EE|nr:hypothetical protein [uncultured Mucilaginibacter sp.]